MKLELIIAFVATFLLSNYTESQNLTAVLSPGRLPARRSKITSIYDGNDTIYLIGGVDHPGHGSTDDTRKFALTDERFVLFAGDLPVTSSAGNVFMNKDKIYYSGEATYLFQYFPSTQTFENVSTLPYQFGHSAVIKPDENTAIFFGGFDPPSAVISLDLNTLQYEKIADLPKTRKFSDFIAAIWVEEKGVAYIFDGITGNENVTRYNRSSNQFEIIPNYFPHIINMPAAVYDGKYIYVIGSFEGIPENCILQFDPDTETSREIPVRNYPGESGKRFFQTSAVYIEKLNRIYMFGGYVQGSIPYRSEIWYVSLDPIGPPLSTTTSTTPTPITTLDPEIFNCVGLGDSKHPFPGICSKYIVCRDDHAYAFDCPEPFLFHPTQLDCMWPDLVDCDI